MKGGDFWKLNDRELPLGAASHVVGILNVTPDSFSDGGEHHSFEKAVSRGLQMLEEGASVIDIGGESTRPGYEPVASDEEIGRVVPVIESLLKQSPYCIISVDTTKPDVAKAAIEAGAGIVNDISGFLADGEMAEVVSHHKAAVILMYNARLDASSGDVLDRVRESWELSVGKALSAGIGSGAIVLDPGIGFGTTRQEDLEILRGLEVLRTFGFPMMLGTSRKRITACPSDLQVGQRLESTIATTVAGIAAGVELFRVHDVAENLRAARLADLIYRGGDLDG